MDISGKTPVFFGRPPDRSLHAFKYWINSMAAALGATDEVTDDQWQAEWQAFWAAADGSTTSAETQERHRT